MRSLNLRVLPSGDFTLHHPAAEPGGRPGWAACYRITGIPPGVGNTEVILRANRVVFLGRFVAAWAELVPGAVLLGGG